MEDSIIPNDTIEVLLRKVELSSPDYRSLHKIALTVIDADGKESSFSQVVRYKIVSFRDQSVKIPNCNSFLIRLGRFFGTSSQQISLGTHEVDVKAIRSSNKNRLKREWQLTQPNCVVHYEIDLHDTPPFEEHHISEQVIPAQDTSKTLELQDDCENTCVSQKTSPNFKSTLHSLSSTVADATFSKNSQAVVEEIIDRQFEKNKVEGKSHGSGTITQKYDDQLEEEVMEMKPVQPKNHMEGVGRFSALQRSSSMNVQIKKVFEEKQNPSSSKEATVKIRLPVGRKLKHMTELEDELEKCLFLRYLSLNTKQLEQRFSAKSQKLNQQLADLKKGKSEILKIKQESEKKQPILKHKLTMAAFLFSGLMMSLLF